VLSLVELERAAEALARLLAGHRVQAATVPDGERVVLEVYGRDAEGLARRRALCLCARPGTARVSLLPEMPKAPPRPPPFAQYLRAHAVGSRIAGARLLDGDRVLAIDLTGPEGGARLVLALPGRRPNVWLLDAEGRVAASLRPPADSRPELAAGELWRPSSGRPPRSGEDRFAGLEGEELLRAIEASYAEREREAEEAGLRQRLERALRREAARLDRKLERIGEELGRAREAAELGRAGELLKGALARVRRGATEIALPDPATGEEVRIELDPALGPAQNLERVFQRQRKAVRGLARAGALHEQARALRERLAALGAELRAAAHDPERLAQLAARPEVAARLAREASPAPRPSGPRARLRLAGREIPARLAPRRYRASGELEIWVGRSDLGNDFLTTRLAGGRDLFFHVEATPGSHVILRTGGRADPPSEAVLDACELAVHFSKLRDADRVDVHVVPIRNVRKPKGAKPGLVHVHGGRSVRLRRSRSRLERVLASRVDERAE
jgi:predicted ribosome quality control (RQC) complex YloA/Tae2 family protein